MSGGPPHHPHNRPMPTGNSAWNNLQVPNFFPRQPQHAHMSSEHPLMHQPTWHTPTTEPLKAQLPHSHIINLEQMLSDRPYLRQSPGVDLSLSRGSTVGGQNGDLTGAAPISLSVRDTNKINSLAASALERQGELESALAKAASPPALAKTKSPTSHDKQPVSPKLVKKVKRVDSILERLNMQVTDGDGEKAPATTMAPVVHASSVVATSTAVIPPATNSSHDENSNSSSILNVPTPREEDVVSPFSNEDSLDSNKSRRKRKPAKMVKVAKEKELPAEADGGDGGGEEDAGRSNGRKDDNGARATRNAESAGAERLEFYTSSPHDGEPRKTRRKGSSEDETIDKIAAMVGSATAVDAAVGTVHDAQGSGVNTPMRNATATTATSGTTGVLTLAQKKDFVAVEDKLEEMFAGLDDSKTDVNSSRGASSSQETSNNSFMQTVDLLSLGNATPSTSRDAHAASDAAKKPLRRKRKPKGSKGGGMGGSGTGDATKKKAKMGKTDLRKSVSNKKLNGKSKQDSARDIYAYDSGSNASSSKSRGPFVHISGPRDSPLSVNVVNTPACCDEDGDAKRAAGRATKKFHDETEARHKVRSKGLHCSTLSMKYDSQTRDATWICAFCKRGPHTNEFADNDAHYTPGDLFGPYTIGNRTPEFQRRLDDPFDKQYVSKKCSRIIDAMGAGKSPPAKKPGRRRQSEVIAQQQLAAEEAAATAAAAVRDYDLGIVRIEEGTFEVWAHEDCFVWASGIYLVGPKIIGLEEAVWCASNVQCARCAIKGASVHCLKRGCTNVMHLGCAYVSRWALDDVNYKAFCGEHSALI